MGWILGLVMWVALIAISVGGWIANIVKLCNYDVFGLLELSRAVGIVVAPIGIILGLFV